MSFTNTASDMSLKVVHALASIDPASLENSVCAEYDRNYKGASVGLETGFERKLEI